MGRSHIHCALLRSAGTSASGVFTNAATRSTAYVSMPPLKYIKLLAQRSAATRGVSVNGPLLFYIVLHILQLAVDGNCEGSITPAAASRSVLGPSGVTEPIYLM